MGNSFIRKFGEVQKTEPGMGENDELGLYAQAVGNPGLGLLTWEPSAPR